MSQFIIIHSKSDNYEKVADLMDQAVTVFRDLFSMTPAHLFKSNSVALAAYPSSNGLGCSLIETASKEWVLLSGSWIIRDKSAPYRINSRQPDTLITALGDIDGNYSIATGSRDGSHLMIACDPLGIFHIYKREIDDCTLYSTSSLLLARLGHVNWLDVSLAEFLATGTIYENRTFYKEITKLSPATIYTHSIPDIPQYLTYWDIHELLANDPRKVEAEDLAECLISSVKLLTEELEKPVFDLTGGLDSRAIIGAALRTGARPIYTNVTGDISNKDVQIANRIARAFGLNHRVNSSEFSSFEEWWTEFMESVLMTDGEYDALEYATILKIHKSLSGEFSSSVNGSAGEAYRGYWWELLLPNPSGKGNFDTRKLASSRFITSDIACDLVPGFNKNVLIEHFSQIISRTILAVSDARKTACMDLIYLHMRMQRWQGRIASSSSRTWQCFSPFIFRRILELGLSARFQDKVNNRLMRHLIETLNSDLALIPTSAGYPAVPIRLDTMHLYGPYVMDLAKRARRYLFRKILSMPYTPATHHSNLFDLLFKDDSCRSYVTPSEMHTSNLLDAEQTSSLINMSKSNLHKYKRYIGRLVTLEALYRIVG